jgi:hypothetical protein
VEPWRSFLRELDELLKGPIKLRCLGGFVLTQQYGIGRETSDIDFLAVIAQSPDDNVEVLAGLGSKLHRRYRLYMQYVGIQQQMQTSPALLRYALELWEATRTPASFGVQLEGINMQRLMLAGASPRGMSMLLQAARVAAWLKGRDFVTPEDVQMVYTPGVLFDTQQVLTK